MASFTAVSIDLEMDLGCKYDLYYFVDISSRFKDVDEFVFHQYFIQI
jgi:hypothetical protein